MEREEQLSLFGDRDPLQDVCDWFVEKYESGKKRGRIKENFDFWLDRFFDRRCGTVEIDGKGAIDGYGFYDTTTETVTFWEEDKKDLIFKKAEILRAFGIRIAKRIIEDTPDGFAEEK